MTRILALLAKELIQMRRDPITIGVTFLLPVIYLVVFGFAIRTDVRHQSTVVFDQSRSEESRNFLAAMTASGYFDLRYIAWSYDELNERIERGDAKIGIVFPPDLVREANAGHTVPIQAIVDASDSIASTSAIAALTGLGMRVQPVAVRGAPVAAPAYDVRIRAWYNPDAVTAYYMLPALMGIILSITMVLMVSMSIVREREAGTLEQLLVTPLQDPALHHPRLHSDDDLRPHRPCGLRRAPAREHPAPLCAHDPLPARLAHDGAHDRIARAEPAAGGAHEHCDAPAGHPPLGLHVPARGDAHILSIPQPCHPHDALHRDPAHDLPQGRRPHGALSADRLSRPLYPRLLRHRRAEIQAVGHIKRPSTRWIQGRKYVCALGKH